MSRDVKNIFLTSLDNIDHFIYRGHGVPEEFRGTFHIRKQCQRGADFLLEVNPNFRGCQVGPMVSQYALAIRRNFTEFIWEINEWEKEKKGRWDWTPQGSPIRVLLGGVVRPREGGGNRPSPYGRCPPLTHYIIPTPPLFGEHTIEPLTSLFL